MENPSLVSRVYCITCLVNGKKYIGKTNKAITERLNAHLNGSLNPKYKFHRAIKKYGVDQFVIELLSEHLTEDEAYAEEKRLIKELDTIKHGYNTAEGGYGKTSQDMRMHWQDPAYQKIKSEQAKLQWQNPHILAQQKASQHKSWSNPELLAKHSKNTKERIAKNPKEQARLKALCEANNSRFYYWGA